MKRQILTTFVALFAGALAAQTDTIFSNNEKIACSVKEITPDAVKFAYPNEELINTVYKNTIQKIVFKSGRVQVFAEATSYKKVTCVEDFENVTITEVESEVKGLYKIGDVSAKAKGTTTYSNQERVKERAYRKMKIVAAMMGANIVYLTDQRGQGNIQSTQFQSGQTTETSLSGVSYSNVLPNMDTFMNRIGTKTKFAAVEENKLWSSSSDLTSQLIGGELKLDSVTNEGGHIVLHGDLTGAGRVHEFRVAYFSSTHFYIYYEDKSTSYNIKLKY